MLGQMTTSKVSEDEYHDWCHEPNENISNSRLEKRERSNRTRYPKYDEDIHDIRPNNITECNIAISFSCCNDRSCKLWSTCPYGYDRESNNCLRKSKTRSYRDCPIDQEFTSDEERYYASADPYECLSERVTCLDELFILMIKTVMLDRIKDVCNSYREEYDTINTTQKIATCSVNQLITGHEEKQKGSKDDKWNIESARSF